MVAALSPLKRMLTRSGGKHFISLDFNAPRIHTYASLDRNSFGMCTYETRGGGRSPPLCAAVENSEANGNETTAGGRRVPQLAAQRAGGRCCTCSRTPLRAFLKQHTRSGRASLPCPHARE